MATHLRTWGTYWLNSGGANPGGTMVYDACGEIRAYLVSQNNENNTSYVRLDHYQELWLSSTSYSLNASSTSSYRTNGGSYKSKTQSIAGYMKGDSSSKFFMGSTYHTVSHNSNGTCTLSVNGSISLNLKLMSGSAQIHSASGSRVSAFSVELPTIPRYTSITSYTRTNITLTSFRVNWKSANTVDRVEYRLNSGSWTLGQTGDRTSGNFTISGRSPNTTYQIQIRVRRKDSGLWTSSSNVNVKTLDIARITSAPNNIPMGDDFTVNYSNPSGSSMEISIFKTNDAYNSLVAYRSCSGSSYKFVLTENEKNNLYNTIPNSSEINLRIYLKTISGSSSWLNSVDRKFIITNANPTFSNFTFADINSQTVGLTGNNQKIIKGYSNLRATVSTADKAIANKGATMKNYQLVVGGKQAIKPYSASANVTIDINAIDNNVFTVYAIDSRGNSTNKIKSPLDFIEYFQPSITNFGFKRENDTGTKTTLILNGNWFNKSFGSVANTLTVKYYFKPTNSTIWSTARTITVTKNGNDFSFSGEIQGDLDANGFDSTKDFDIKIELTDKLGVYTFDGYLIESGEPDIALHNLGVAIKAPYDESLGDGFQINGDKITFNGLTLFEWVED